MKRFLKNLGAAFLLLASTTLHAQISLVENGQPKARIVIGNSPADRQAAELLQDFVQRITHAGLPIAETSTLHKGDIVIGQGSIEGLTEDGFRLKTENEKLFVSSGGDKGSIYGIVTLLEQYLGVSCYAAGAYSFPETSTLTLPLLNHVENPAFRYRQSQNYGLRMTLSTNYGFVWKSRTKFLYPAIGYIRSADCFRLRSMAMPIPNIFH